MNFEWDAAKNQLNLCNHGVSFEDAVRVFSDPYRIERFDLEHSADEDRWITIGMAYPAILMVVYTLRQGGSAYRLISARQANEREQREYGKICFGYH